MDQPSKQYKLSDQEVFIYAATELYCRNNYFCLQASFVWFVPVKLLRHLTKKLAAESNTRFLLKKKYCHLLQSFEELPQQRLDPYFSYVWNILGLQSSGSRPQLFVVLFCFAF